MSAAAPVARVQVDGVAVSPDHLIGGQRVPSPTTFEDRSPLDWSWKLADIARGDANAAHGAVTAALMAFRPWADLGPAGRAEHLHRLADAIKRHNDELAIVEAVDSGLLHASMRDRLVARGAENLRLYADLAVAHSERAWSSKGTRNTVVRMPAGPAVVITPWNAPFMLSTWKLAPALAAGNTVVLKPAEWAPLSCSVLAELTVEAGLPPGVFNLVQGIGDEVGPPLVADPRVKRISFTGSPETARSIARAAADNIVPFTSELGGKGPLIVCADADLDAAAVKAAGQYDDAGQVCLAGTRLLVEASVRDDFLSRFHAAVDRHVLGDSRDPTTTIAPMIHPDHVERVLAFITRAAARGDRVVRGGHRVGDSLHVEPTLIEPASNDSEIVQREVFGPVLTFQTFATDDEAIELANSTAYGLSAIIYTSSAKRAERVGRAVRSGVVWVNTFLVRDLTAPFGGIGISGIGREGGEYALDFHSDLKTLQIADGTVH